MIFEQKRPKLTRNKTTETIKEHLLGGNPLKSIMFLVLFILSCGGPEYQDQRQHDCNQPPTPPVGPIQPSQPCGVTFVDLQSILVRSCSSCHPDYAQYQTAYRDIDKFINRINLPSSDPRSMPRAGPLPENEKALFQQWKANGTKERCETNTGGAPISPSLGYIEDSILRDLNANPIQRRDFRYLVIQGSEDAKAGQDSINKTINSLSLEPRLTSATAIDTNQQVFRINLRDYGLSQDDWNLIEQQDSLKFESFTPNGQLIKAIVNTRQPWLHQNNFTFISHQDSTYYALLDIPSDQREFLNLNFINVNFAQQLQNLEVDYIGFNGSPISLNKNRLIARNRSQFGYMWTTYDVFNVQNTGNNLFQDPFLAESNSDNIFQFDASEIIFTLPNGLQGYTLWDSAGQLQNFAPTDLVTDNEGLDPEINNALDCQRCHSGGIINAEDQIRATVIGNVTFGIRDQQLAELLFTDNEQAIIGADNQSFSSALGTLGISSQSDPISQGTDLLRSDYNLAKLANLTLLSTQQLTLCIQSSATLQNSIGQILRGAAVTFEQIQVSFNDIKRDCQLGREFIR